MERVSVTINRRELMVWRIYLPKIERVLGVAMALALTACAQPTVPAAPAAPAASAPASQAPAAAAPSAAPQAAAKGIQLKPGEKLKVGFLMVGPKDDYGYNQAVDQGRMAME